MQSERGARDEAGQGATTTTTDAALVGNGHEIPEDQTRTSPSHDVPFPPSLND